MINNTYTSTSNMQQQQKLNEQKIFEQFVANCTSKTADAPKGYLVHQNPIQALGSSIKDTGKDIVNLGHTLKTGEGTDHSIGRFNDLGMKLAGLTIASYLALHKAPLNKKLLEFIGFGTFFAGMSLWPKIAINAPLKARFGFDIGQKYVDSQGRKQRFFQDPQYLPWDTWSKEEINHVADKMGIDKNIEDRDELTKKKMRKIAVQGNTLWMLTAGFATPLLSALSCSALEKPVENFVINNGLRNAEGNVKDLDSFLKAAKNMASNPGFDYNGQTYLNKAMSLAKDGNVDDMMDNLVSALRPSTALGEHSKLLLEMPGIDSVDIMGDLKREFSTLMADDSIAKIAEITGSDKEAVKGIIDKLDDNVKGSIFYDTDKLIAHLEKANIIKGQKADAIEILTNSSDIEGATARKFKAIISKVGDSADDIIDALKSDGNIVIKNEENLRSALKNAKSGSNTEEVKQTLNEALTGIKRAKGNDFAQNVKDIYHEAVKPLKAKLGVQDSVLDKVGMSMGRDYNKLRKIILQQVSATNKELNGASKSTGVAGQEIVDAFKTLAKSGKDEEYSSLISSIAQISFKDTKHQKMFKQHDAIISSLYSVSDDAVDQSAQLLREKGLKFFSGIADKKLGDSQGLFGALRKAVNKNNIGAGATRNRAIMLADFIRKEADGTLEAQWKEITGQANVSKEEMQSVFSKGLNILTTGTMSDASNGHNIETTAGEHFRNMMNLLFAKPMDKKTIEACGNALGDLNESRVAAAAIASSSIKYTSRANYVDPSIFNGKELQEFFKKMTAETTDIKYQHLGQSISDLFNDAAGQFKNNKNWTKIFGIAGIALVATTLFTQLFFGKVKEAKLYEKNNSQGTVNGNK